MWKCLHPNDLLNELKKIRLKLVRLTKINSLNLTYLKPKLNLTNNYLLMMLI
jgi:hypothetical protein